MKKNIFLQSCLIFSLLLSCNKSNKESSIEMQYKADIATASAMEIELSDLQEIDHAATSKSSSSTSKQESIIQENTTSKKVIRKGNISIESKNNKTTKANIDKLVKETDAYYESESTTAGSSYMNYNLLIRIPSNQFDSFLEKIENGSDKITQKTISSEDVSLQYVDIDSRIKSKKAYLERYQQMVSGAKTTKDLLEIEEQIRQLQEDIESNANILRSMSDQINYSTLTVDIYYADSGNINEPNSFFEDITIALSDGWDNIKRLTLSIISTWPLLILLVIIIVYVLRRFNKKKTSSNLDQTK